MGPGPLTLEDIVKMLPNHDPMVIVKVSGESLKLLIENGVSKVPRLEGRFPMVSGMSFKYDSSKPEGERVNIEDITIKGEKLDPKGTYTISTIYFLSLGKDGYTEFKYCDLLNDPETAIDF